MIQASAMPKHLPPTAHVHQMNCVLPQSALDAYGQHDPYFPDMRIKKLLEDLTGRHIPELEKGYGHRYQFSDFYTLANEYGQVLAVVYVNGANKFRDKMVITFNGLAWETWNAHNPLCLDPVAVCNFVEERKGHLSRIDIALNDYRQTVDWSELVHCSGKEQFRTRMNIKLNKTRPPYFCRQETESVYFGSNKGKTQILAYQRPCAAAHHMPDDCNGLKYPSWVRFEVKVRGRVQADHVAKMIREGMSIETLTKGVLAYYITFLEKGTATKIKTSPCRWWTQFVGTDQIRLTPPKPPKPSQPESDFDGFDTISF